MYISQDKHKQSGCHIVQNVFWVKAYISIYHEISLLIKKRLTNIYFCDIMIIIEKMGVLSVFSERSTFDGQ